MHNIRNDQYYFECFNCLDLIDNEYILFRHNLNNFAIRYSCLIYFFITYHNLHSHIHINFDSLFYYFSCPQNDKKVTFILSLTAMTSIINFGFLINKQF